MKKYTAPVIVRLDEYAGYTTQCKMFSMPKRSCKSLPSGMFAVKNKKQSNQKEI